MRGLFEANRESASGAALNVVKTVGGKATGMTVTASSGAKTFTRAAGNWITDGFAVGDVVWFFGFTAGPAVMNGANFTITVLTDTVMTVSETVTAATSAPSIECYTAERDVDTNLVLNEVMVSYSVAPAARVAVQLKDKSGVLWQSYFQSDGGSKEFEGGFALPRGRSLWLSCAAGGGSVVTRAMLGGATL